MNARGKGRRLRDLAFALGLGAGLAGCASDPAATPDRDGKAAFDPAFAKRPAAERLREAFDRRLEAGLGWAYVAAVHDRTQTRLVARGKRALEPVREASTRDLYEIGSISKLFTGLLLEIAAFDRRLSLDDRLEKYFPELAGKPVGAATLRELGLHSAGLPSAPPALRERSIAQPWRGWTEAMVRAPLETVELAPPGKDGIRPRAYSNWNYLILGRVLELATGKPYATLLRERILAPLRMRDTGVDLRASAKRGRKGRKTAPAARLAPAYTLGAEPAEGWEFDGFAAATGGIESTGEDMGRFLEGMREAFQTAAFRRDALGKLQIAFCRSRETGVGWDSRPGERVLWKNGMTGAYSAILVWDRDSPHGIPGGVFIAGNSPVSVDGMVGIAIGSDARDRLPEPVLGAPAPAEAAFAAIRGFYRAKDAPAEGAVPDAEKDGHPRSAEVVESFGRARLRLGLGRGLRDGALLLATKDADEWIAYDGFGGAHRFERTRRGARLVAQDAEGRQVAYEFEKVERPAEQYPAIE